MDRTIMQVITGHMCAMCVPKPSGSPHHLQQHKAVHQQKRSAKCPSCKKYCSRAEDLKWHLTKCNFALSANAANAPDAHDGSDDNDLSQASEELIALQAEDDQENSNEDDGSSDEHTLCGGDDEVQDDERTSVGEANDVAMETDYYDELDHVRDHPAVDDVDRLPAPRAFHGYRSPTRFSSRASSVDKSMLFRYDGLDQGVPQKDRPAASAADFTGLEKLFGSMSVRDPSSDAESNRQRTASTEKHRRLPLHNMRDVFEFLRRDDLIAASFAQSCFRNLTQTKALAEVRRHFAHLVIEPAVANQRFGTGDHGWTIPRKSGTVLWCEMGHDGAPGLYKFFSSVPNAVQYVVKMKLLHNAYVEDFALHQNATSTAVVPPTLWRKLGDAVHTTAIGQWSIDGIGGMDMVAKIGDILAPFRTVKALRSLAVRRCDVFSNKALQALVNECCPGIQWA